MVPGVGSAVSGATSEAAGAASEEVPETEDTPKVEGCKLG